MRRETEECNVAKALDQETFQKASPITPGRTTCILKNIDLEIAEGAFFTLLGPSGCGKSTLLNIVAGFEEPTSGELEINGTPIKGPGTDRTVIFQDVSNALFPYMTVFRERRIRA